MSDDEPMEHEEAASTPAGETDVHAERRRLLALAFRMTGTIAEAEDVVQETYLRWYRLSAAERAAIVVPAAWLTRVAGRIALDVLKSARVRREQKVGQWLPEPVPAEYFAGTVTSGASPVQDPLERVTLDDEVSTALLVVLEAMTPAERVAFVLHDVFGTPFDEIAEIVGRSAAATRQLATSARRHLRERRSVAASAQRHDELVRAFLTAARGGDLQALVRTLDPAVELRADGGDVIRAAPNVILGADHVGRFLLGLLRKQPELRFAERRTADGLGYALSSSGRIQGLVSFRTTPDGITDVWLMLDPARLGLWQAEDDG